MAKQSKCKVSFFVPYISIFKVIILFFVKYFLFALMFCLVTQYTMWRLYMYMALTANRIWKSCEMSNVVRKPVFGVSDQVRHKPGCTATEDG